MLITNREEMFRAAIRMFHQDGVKDLTEKKIVLNAGIDPESFFELFNSKEEFVRQAVEFTLEEQKEQETGVLHGANNPVEEIILLSRYWVSHLQHVHPSYFIQIQYFYPQAWQAYTRHTQMHLYFTLYELVNKGVVQGYFRGDINLDIITKVLIEQINIMYNTHLFPAYRYQTAEVFRNIFYYYLKGISTSEGANLLQNFFANR
jgi:AcrR family transcriptional regulator